ncbi:MAG: Rrf2 family transcriptional regulator [Saprospiraceae bacterium]|nr:Rrf2 family transcriptional regulator [Saprospiraceae bacterium]
MFSKSCEYAIKAVLFIAQRSALGFRCNLGEISKEIDSPVAFTAKILQELVRKGLISSLKGPTGGFTIEKSALRTMKLSHIVEAIDGDNVYQGCGLGHKQCNASRPCPVHHQFMAIRDKLKEMVQQTTVSSLADGVECGLTFLK